MGLGVQPGNVDREEVKYWTLVHSAFQSREGEDDLAKQTDWEVVSRKGGGK